MRWTPTTPAKPKPHPTNRARRLRIEETGAFYFIRTGKHTSKPGLRIKGAWLARPGFAPGAYVRVSVTDGKLIIETEETHAEETVQPTVG